MDRYTRRNDEHSKAAVQIARLEPDASALRLIESATAFGLNRHTRALDPSSPYKSSVLKVSPWLISPVSKPFLNHLTRWALVPWVKESGTT